MDSITDIAERILLHRRKAYGVGWGLVFLAVVVSLAIDDTNATVISRYPADIILSRAGEFGLVVTAVAVVGASLRLLRFAPVLGALCVCALFLPITLSRGVVRDPFSNSICTQTRGCFFLTVTGFTDTVYELWTASSRLSVALRRVPGSEGINYSEDGSYTKNAHLLVSANERILVLARGGLMVDAIDLQTGERLSDLVSGFNGNDDEGMRRHSEKIGRILEANRS